MFEIDVKKLRESMELSQEQLARLLNCSVWTVYRLEKKLHKPHPGLQEKLEKLAKKQGGKNGRDSRQN